jgi:hypothetical protein
MATNSSVLEANKNRVKTRNCGPFYKEKVCMYGARCLYRHEHRPYATIFRHYYVPHLYVLERLFANSRQQDDFLETYASEVPRLSVFREITSDIAPKGDFDVFCASLAADVEEADSPKKFSS